jgi:RNA polymerase sigma-70 factor (ECF subfamily)
MLAEQPPMDSDPTFREVFHRYYWSVCKLFRRYGFSEEEAQELTQDAFLRVHKAWADFRGESQLTTWVFQIARNLALNAVRSRKTLKRDAQEVSLDETGRFDDEGGVGDRICVQGKIDGNPLAEVLDAERSQMLRKALQSLPPQMRRCVELRLNEDLKYREIAELLDISIDTVKAHLFQARQHLKAKLSDYFSDIDKV